MYLFVIQVRKAVFKLSLMVPCREKNDCESFFCWGIQLFLMLVLGQYLVLEVTRSLTGSEHPPIQHAERLRKDTMSDSLTGREGRGLSEQLRFAHLLKTFCGPCCGYSVFRWLIFPLSQQNYSANPTTSQHLPALWPSGENDSWELPDGARWRLIKQR